MYAIPLNIAEPLMGLDILRIIWVNITTSIVLIPTSRRGCISRLISSTAQAMFLLLNDTSDEILASSADRRSVRKLESRLMTQDIHLRLLSTTFFREKWSMTVQTLFEC